MGAVFIELGSQLYMLFWIRKQEFYYPFVAPEDEEESTNAAFEQTSLFMIAIIQLIVTCVIFSRSSPFRK